jgi:hypothetical protein
MKTIINKPGFNKSMNTGSKKGQVTIFIIVALVIVAILLIIFLYPRFRTSTQQAFSPETFLSSCIEPQLKPVIAQLGLHAGYLTPEGTVQFKDQNVKYLCYTSKYYETCLNQQPMIKENFEKNLVSFVSKEASLCMSELKAEYEQQGYSVTLGQINSNVSLVPGNVKIRITAPMTVTKESSQNFNHFDINVRSQMYDLTMIASSIVEFESTYGNSETTLYMQYYPDLKIIKTQLSDGTRIYEINNVVTNETFTFASRSVAWPPGYGII